MAPSPPGLGPGRPTNSDPRIREDDRPRRVLAIPTPIIDLPCPTGDEAEYSGCPCVLAD